MTPIISLGMCTAAGTRLDEARCLRRCAYWARSGSLSGLARSDSEEVMECEAVPGAPDPPPVTLRRLALRARWRRWSASRCCGTSLILNRVCSVAGVGSRLQEAVG